MSTKARRQRRDIDLFVEADLHGYVDATHPCLCPCSHLLFVEKPTHSVRFHPGKEGAGRYRVGKHAAIATNAPTLLQL